jgi:hypothetical protein
MENALDMFYTGYNNEFIAKVNECNCHEKIPTKEFLQFPLICRQCFEKVAQEAEIYNRKGCPEAKLKWVHATWIHKELNLLEEILEAKPIPNSQDFIAITSNETYLGYNWPIIDFSIDLNFFRLFINRYQKMSPRS